MGVIGGGANEAMKWPLGLAHDKCWIPELQRGRGVPRHELDLVHAPFAAGAGRIAQAAPGQDVGRDGSAIGAESSVVLLRLGYLILAAFAQNYPDFVCAVL